MTKTGTFIEFKVYSSEMKCSETVDLFLTFGADWFYVMMTHNAGSGKRKQVTRV